ncbi:MAG: CDC48 family AAA ATPase [Methanothrix sp.]|nr:CDC48 family AAA ATPase [Methanothrix sp.]MDD1740514.1 CDC48 family AAA ATPase [Methanothrix sp.]OYV10894.1 MAG: transitional endoplasmic reticulum ATPase [Methanosaeta sp. ASO1]
MTSAESVQEVQEGDNSVQLRVAEAYHKDAGKGVARIGAAAMASLSLENGGVVEIKGKDKLYAIAWPGNPEDSEDLIRIDGNTRANLGAGIDSKVAVSRAQARPARKIVVAPTRPIRLMGGPAYLLRMLQGRAVVKGEMLRVEMINSSLNLAVVSTMPGGAVLVTPETIISITRETLEELALHVREISYEDIGGLAREIREIREMIEVPLRHPELFSRLGINPPRGVLLYGPPGTGKTLIARAVAGETDANFISISGPEIVSKFYGESEQRLRQIFDEAAKTAPSIIFIDEIDSIAPKREEVSGDLERRVVAQLLSLMDGLSSRGEVIVIAATNRPNALDPAIRRGGRFDREVEIGIPNKNGRLEVLYVHTRGMPLDESLDLKEVADATHGFVGADLYALCKEAAMRTLERALPDLDIKEDIPAEVVEGLLVTKEDFSEAMKKIEPSAMREVFVEVAEVHWDEVGGLEGAKKALIEAVDWPLKYPEAFSAVGIRPPRGILLYGLPGTGKTLLVRALATESNINFISVKGPELLSKWVGESERAVREVFRKARQAAPALIFFDEIDSLLPGRGSGSDSHATERVVSQFLTEMDGLVQLKDVVVVAATNRPDLLDSSMLRPGRFDRLIYIPMPDIKARARILEIFLSKMACSGVSPQWLAELTEGFSGADLEMLCHEAGMLALREHIRPEMRREELIIDRIRVSREHFQEVSNLVRPHLSKEMLEEYQKMICEFKA